MSKIAIVITSICVTCIATAVIVVAVFGIVGKNHQNNVAVEATSYAASTESFEGEDTTVDQEDDDRNGNIELPSDKKEDNVAQTEQILEESKENPATIDESESESEEQETEAPEEPKIKSAETLISDSRNNADTKSYADTKSSSSDKEVSISAQEETSSDNDSSQMNPESYSYEELMEADGDTLKQIVDACGSYEEYMDLLARKENASNVKTLEGNKESEANGNGSGISFKK